MAEEQDKKRKEKGKAGAKQGDEPEWKNSQRGADVALPSLKYSKQKNKKKKS